MLLTIHSLLPPAHPRPGLGSQSTPRTPLLGQAPRRIRNWETEYKLLRPARTKGGHRLYSIGDVKRLRDIRRLTQEEGMSLQAVRSWLNAQPEGHLLAVQQSSGSKVSTGP